MSVQIHRAGAATSGSAGSFVLLSTQTASASATLDFTSVITSSYDVYIFDLVDIKPATDSVSLYLRTSTDNGSTYDSGVSDYTWHYEDKDIGGASGYALTNDAADAQIVLCASEVGNAAAEGISGRVILSGPLDATRRKHVEFNFIYQTQATAHRHVFGIGGRAATADITAVRFLMESGNIASGKIYLYGLKNS
jgi:hypothetical protein